MKYDKAKFVGAIKAVPWRKCVALNACIKKEDLQYMI